MWTLTCIPVNVYNVLYKFKPVFRCAQARHFWVFCWLLMALILDNGKGRLKDLLPVFASKTPLLDVDADGAVRTRGRLGVGERDES